VIAVPFVHIADSTADAVSEAGASTVGLLATTYTMEHDFYVGLRGSPGLEVLVRGREDRGIVHRVIYDELCVGVVTTIPDASTAGSWRPGRAGREAILLGCTEIDLLVGPDDAPVPVFDTTRLHAESAVEMAPEPLRGRRPQPCGGWRGKLVPRVRPRGILYRFRLRGTASLRPSDVAPPSFPSTGPDSPMVR
jgi:hypothetical protein